jgi:eukaryotic-like serine/threonine-protein kinase
MAPDGHSLITSAGITQSSVWVHDAKGDRQISSEGQASLPGLGFGASSARTVFSPDGKKFFYLVRKEASRAFTSGELWMADLDSGRNEDFFPGILMNDFDISRDGTRVVFSSVNAEGTSRVWVTALDRRTPPQLLIQGEADRPCFGPAGEIFFRVREGNSDFIYRMEKSGVTPQKVSPQPVPEFHGVSPDGQWWIQGFSPPTAHSTRGGASVRICNFCNVGWGPGGKFLYLRFRGIGPMGGGKTVVITLLPGTSLPAFPPTGLQAAEDAKALNLLTTLDMTGIAIFAPGPNPSTYAYSRLTVQRNLFRIPLN